MREIRFRAWDKDIGVMDYSRFRRFSIDDMVKDGLILMQFTGLLDKNGKEIYEGDILETSGGIHKVEWDSVGGFYPFVDVSCLIEDGIVEIIGNIYENPELLTTPITN